jgi:hypothetical protein
MNAPVRYESAPRILPAIDVLEIQAQVRADLWWQYQMELHQAVDELQACTEQSGLLNLIGQDAVQAIIAAPFARLRAMASDDGGDLLQDDDSDFYVDDIVRRWELADPRDRWKHTGEAPPKAVDVARPRPAPYRTPEATVNAFRYVVSIGNRDYVAEWIASHPADAPHLLKILDEGR